MPRLGSNLDIRVDEIKADIENNVNEWMTSESLASDRFSATKSDCSITFVVPGDKIIAFKQYALGLAYVDDASADINKFTRILPMFHPFHQNMICTDIQITGMGPNGKYNEIDDPDMIFWTDVPKPAKWHKYKVVAYYSLPPYQVLPDSAIDSEIERFVEWIPVQKTDLVHVPHGMVTYDANVADAFDGKPIMSPRISPVALARREVSSWKLIWHQVPYEWIAADSESFPAKFGIVKGRINDSNINSLTALGCPQNTLMCMDIKVLRRYPSLALCQNTDYIYFACDVEMDFQFYDPFPKGKTAETRAGWNFGLGPDLKYYYMTTTVDFGSLPVFQEIDFDQIWSKYDDDIVIT